MRMSVLMSLAALSFGASSAQAMSCPGQEEVQAALEKYINSEFWSPSQRDTWKITDVSDFQFGPIKAGRIIQKQVEYGRSAEDVCPIRIEYSFQVTHADGRVERTAKGSGETHLFYLNGFDEWTFKVSSG